MSNSGKQRDSVFGGLLLITVGVVLLLYRFEPTIGIGHLIRIYWPLLIILWGVAKLFDHLIAQTSGVRRAPFLTGGEVVLLFLALIVLGGYGLHDWMRTRYPDLDIRLGPFGKRYSQSQALAPKVIPAGSHVTIKTGRGGISVHIREGETVSVTANLSADRESETTADNAMKGVPVVIEQTKDGYSIHPVNQESSAGPVSVDLDVEVPKNVSITATSDRGDIQISGVAGSVTAATQKGTVEIHDTGSDVSADIESSDARISGVSGNVRLTGHGNEIDIGDVAGNASLEGDFYGGIHLRNIAKTTHYVTGRDNLTIVQMTGRLELDSDSIQLTDVAGSASLQTRNKDVDAENVTGRLDINDSHAGVTVRYSNPPRQDLSVTNDSGEVEVTLPSNANFEIAAASRGGEVDSDFDSPSLKAVNNADTGQLNGKVGGPGPKITIVTTYGTISLHQS